MIFAVDAFVARFIEAFEAEWSVDGEKLAKAVYDRQPQLSAHDVARAGRVAIRPGSLTGVWAAFLGPQQWPYLLDGEPAEVPVLDCMGVFVTLFIYGRSPDPKATFEEDLQWGQRVLHDTVRHVRKIQASYGQSSPIKSGNIQLLKSDQQRARGFEWAWEIQIEQPILDISDNGLELAQVQPWFAEVSTGVSDRVLTEYNSAEATAQFSTEVLP